MIDIAKEYYKLGLSVIPIREDKRPSTNGHLYKWKKHTEKLIEPTNIFNGCYGIGLVTGKVSGNIEVIDIDLKYDITGNLFKELKELINFSDSELLKKLVVQKTVNNGYHFIYKCREIGGNTKLASRYTTEEEKQLNPKEKEKVLLETRGEGGFIACYPTPGYSFIYGNLSKIHEITEQERKTLFDCAKSFQEVYDAPYEKKEVKTIIENNLSPLEDWNERGDVLGVLESEGWVITNTTKKRNFLLRPGGTGKWSAEYHSEKRLFYVWTSSSEFENDKAYNPSQVLTTLRFNGDYSECAIWLLKNGYGKSIENSVVTEKKEVNIDNLLSIEKDESAWIDLVVKDSIPLGYDIGSEHFDNHFRLKEKTMVGIFGVDNVGKTTFHHFIAVCYSKRHKVNWLLICKENKSQSVRQKIMELYHGKPLNLQTKEQLNEAREFAYKYFDIVNDTYELDKKTFFEVIKKAFKKKHYFAVFIDPYNSIQFEQTPNSNYEFLGRLREFQNTFNTSFHISMHISTEKARNYVYSDKETIVNFYGEELSVAGQFKIPRKNFVEGGQPIANKLDDIIIVHRIQKMSELRMYTLVSIDKVKEEQTGGMVSFEEPIMFLKQGAFNTFIDRNKINPLADHKPYLNIKENVMTPNEDFDKPYEEIINDLYNNDKDAPF